MSEIESAIRTLLQHVGENPDREGLIETPKRVAKAWLEMTDGYQKDPSEILSKCFEEGTCDEMVILSNIEFTSTCEHHLLPFKGTATVGYLPNDSVVGLSKMARLVDCFAHRLQIQEKMTGEIADSLDDALKPKGVAVVVEAHHQCMSCRGIRKQGTVMITSAMRGMFKTHSNVRAEFLSLIGKK